MAMGHSKVHTRRQTDTAHVPIGLSIYTLIAPVCSSLVLTTLPRFHRVMDAKTDIPGNANVFFKEEREGWHGYVEWEKYPEKKREAAEILKQHTFDEVCRAIRS